MKKFLILVLLMLININLFAQKITNISTVNNKGVSIAIDAKGMKWVLTTNSLYTFDDTKYTRIIENEGVTLSNAFNILIDKDDVKWINTNDGVYSYNGKKWKKYTTDDGLVDNQIYYMAIDKSGNKWFGSPRKGISKFNGKKFTNYSKEEGTLKYYSINNIFVDSKGVVWIGNGDGLVNYNGSKWTYKDDISTAPEATGSLLGIDSKNQIWVSILDTLRVF